MSEVERERVERYLAITDEALRKLVISPPLPSHLRKVAEDFLTMARSYRDDAEHFLKKGDLVSAFACVNYAHGWIDAGARLGLWDVGGDRRLFTLLE